MKNTALTTINASLSAIYIELSTKIILINTPIPVQTINVQQVIQISLTSPPQNYILVGLYLGSSANSSSSTFTVTRLNDISCFIRNVGTSNITLTSNTVFVYALYMKT